MIKRPFSNGRLHQRRFRRSAPASGLRRMGDVALAAAILLLLALVMARLDQVSQRQVSGLVAVADGDSLTIDGERVRLRGIDAPELAQTCTVEGASYPCGERARNALVKLAGSGTVTCEGWERDRYDRLLARCRVQDRDLGGAMVEAGWAIAYGDYGEAEARARRAGRGVWAGTFEAPQQWRARRKAPDEMAHDWLGQVVNFLRQLFWTWRTA